MPEILPLPLARAPSETSPGRARRPNPESRAAMTCATPRRRPLALVLLLLGASAPAAAQVVVHDPTSYGSLIQQAQTALDQLQEARRQADEVRRLHDAFNSASDVNGLARALAAPELRRFLPDTDAYAAAARGDLEALGGLGRAAEAIRRRERVLTPPPEDRLGRDLERQGDRAARDLALGQAASAAGARRLEGLEELQAALAAAPSARAVMDLQARLAAEQAMIANDQMRLQGLSMAQAAEDRLQAQRDRERAAAERAARLEMYRRTFR